MPANWFFPSVNGQQHDFAPHVVVDSVRIAIDHKDSDTLIEQLADLVEKIGIYLVTKIFECVIYIGTDIIVSSVGAKTSLSVRVVEIGVHTDSRWIHCARVDVMIPIHAPRVVE